MNKKITRSEVEIQIIKQFIDLQCWLKRRYPWENPFINIIECYVVEHNCQVKIKIEIIDKKNCQTVLQ
jgi:hypothetical protein